MCSSDLMAEDVRILISSESRLSDSIALLDTYGVQVWNHGLLLQQGPLCYCANYESLIRPLKEAADLFPVIDQTIEVRLIHWPLSERKDRWPFFVESPLKILLTLGDQWWEYAFSPGRMYEERGWDSY